MLRLVLVLLLELLRVTCGVAEVLRLVLEIELELLRLSLARLTDGAVVVFERETAADWLLLLVLPPCERLRPWAIASDALKIRHPMRAKLIMIFVTEVFIIVNVLNSSTSDFKFCFVCLLDVKPYTKFNRFMRYKPHLRPIGHKNATNRHFS